MAATMHMTSLGTTQLVSKFKKFEVVARVVATLRPPWPRMRSEQLRAVRSGLESSHPRQPRLPNSTLINLQNPGEIQNLPDKDALEKHDHNKANQENIKQWIEEIRGMFRIMTDGEISKSPYDTAWVALVPALDGSDGPQFPKALQWIIDNQLVDGSWGDSGYFSYCDRVCHTLACVVVLQHWNSNSAVVEAGVKFIQQNLHHMMETDIPRTVAFEIVFPALINDARKLGLDLPYDSPTIVTITDEGNKKLKKIPMDILQNIPTPLLFSLEGLHEELDWRKLLRMQSEDGSFLGSPSSTAACLLHIKDEKALGYLNRVLDRFNNAVPNVFPVDCFEHLWIVDWIQRLGLDRYFQKEIKETLDHVYKYFNNFSGIEWKRDLDDTAMGFRLLRQHGYDVNENVFRQFKDEDDEFCCFPGQSNHYSITALLNFYRAAQTRFPGETVLKSGESFSRSFLREKCASKECVDKWIISKDLAWELEYALNTPWYYSPPRVETRAYLNHYGPKDIWIGKCLHRMLFLHNETFLALAKADFNLCQSIHQEDFQQILRWNKECELGKLTYMRQTCYENFFSAVNVFPDPKLTPARLVFTRTSVLQTMVDDYFDSGRVLLDMHKFVAAVTEWDASLMDDTDEEARITFNALYNSINAMALEVISAQGFDKALHIRNAWLKILKSHMKEAEWTASGDWPSLDEYLEIALPSLGLEVMMLYCLFFFGETISDELINNPQRLHLTDLLSRVVRLLNDMVQGQRETSEGKANAVSILLQENSSWTEEDAIAKIRAMVEESMLELVREVHQPSDHISKPIRQAYFNIARLAHLFYNGVDCYSTKNAMKERVEEILLKPIMS